jgi:Tol biopolymer transport system component
MTPERQIAHYVLTSKLGEGGMGTVYRATDTKLQRDVAVKLLPDAFAADPDRLARFTREALLLASLNHPNIAAIYGVEERALVMELIEGPTLAERIQRGPMPVEEALPLACEIASALEYAHERGVIHRDLKPANIKQTADGRVKVLDFGLAKALTGGPEAANPMSSPTLTVGATVAGVILGTASYMSPEQARGMAVDKRADIWSFGVVLYEMLTGRGLFHEGTLSDTIAALLRSELDWSALPAAVPAHVRRVLRRCLERDPKRRARDIGDVRLELEQGAPDLPAPLPPPRAAGPFRFLPWVAAAALALAAGSLAVIHFREQPPAAQPMKFAILPPQNGNFGFWAAVSPDGRYLAYTAMGADGQMQIWGRPIDSLEARPFAGTAGVVTFFWSSDSRSIAFGAPGKLKRFEISGGPSRNLCDLPGVLLGGRWQGEAILFGTNSGPIMKVPSNGGSAIPITKVEPSRAEITHSDPTILPDGRQFIYLRRSAVPANAGIYVGSLDLKPEDQRLDRLQETEYSPAYAPPHGNLPAHLLFMRDDSLVAQAFDDRSLKSVGEPVPVADSIANSLTRAFFSVSANGVLFYRSGGGPSRQLNWHDRDGKVVGRAGEPGDFQDVSLSPDGARAAYSQAASGGNRQIKVLDFARGTSTLLTSTPEGARSPVWSRDGKQILYASIRGNGLYVTESNGSGRVTPLAREGGNKLPTDWSRDGRHIVCTEASATGLDILAYSDPLGASGTRIPIAVAPAIETQGQLSPDGKWIAYASNAGGRYEVYVQPFPSDSNGAGRLLISSAGGVQPRWRGDGRELFYLATDRKLMAIDIKTEPTFEAGAPHRLFDTLVAPANTVLTYAVTNDGKRFLLVEPAAGEAVSPATVVLNWQQMLKK